MPKSTNIDRKKKKKKKKKKNILIILKFLNIKKESCLMLKQIKKLIINDLQL